MHRASGVMGADESRDGLIQGMDGVRGQLSGITPGGLGRSAVRGIDPRRVSARNQGRVIIYSVIPR
jgi:hypothetical protein